MGASNAQIALVRAFFIVIPPWEWCHAVTEAADWAAVLPLGCTPGPEGCPCRATYKGMLPCFLAGFSSRLLRSMSSALINRGRVSRGSITSST